MVSAARAKVHLSPSPGLGLDLERPHQPRRYHNGLGFEHLFSGVILRHLPLMVAQRTPFGLRRQVRFMRILVSKQNRRELWVKAPPRPPC
jgi:hypothetical protein